MFNLGFPELILILVVALIVIGPQKLPEAGAAIGKALREFKENAVATKVMADSQPEGDASRKAEAN